MFSCFMSGCRFTLIMSAKCSPVSCLRHSLSNKWAHRQTKQFSETVSMTRSSYDTSDNSQKYCSSCVLVKEMLLRWQKIQNNISYNISTTIFNTKQPYLFLLKYFKPTFSPSPKRDTNLANTLNWKGEGVYVQIRRPGFDSRHYQKKK
jgi:hypothetical protein